MQPLETELRRAGVEFDRETDTAARTARAQDNTQPSPLPDRPRGETPRQR